ncbi:MAG: hypothetical protein AAB501_01750 [Patescibacteria group bacterium]
MINYNSQKTYSVKKPVRSFRDLEVYQKTLEASVIVVKDISAGLAKIKCPFVEELVKCALGLPMALASAHSTRFGNHENSISMLERILVGCNKMVVYLEQAKGIYGDKIDVELVDDLVRRYSEARMKIFRLEKSWQKWYEPSQSRR